MTFPIKTCVVCGEEFELKPDKPGFANRCPECSEPESAHGAANPQTMDAEERRLASEADAERRKAIRDLLYRKE
jgi:predicted amidophosphoribosyltransferase